MRRKLFNIAAVLSLVLCLAVAALWVRSEFVEDVAVYRDSETAPTGTFHCSSFSIASRDGGIACLWQAFAVDDPAGRRKALWSNQYTFNFASSAILAVSSGDPSMLGFQWKRQVRYSFTAGTESGSGESWGFRMPYWFWLILLAAPPAIWLRRHVRTRAQGRLARGLCGACGYDLRATPDRCPECGAVPQAVPRAAT